MKEIEKIQQVANENPQGFTFSLLANGLLNVGIVVAYYATQNSFEQLGLKKCIAHAKKHDYVVGGWFNGKQMQYDSCKVFRPNQLKEAIEFGKKQKQYAIYILHKQQEIIL